MATDQIGRRLLLVAIRGGVEGRPAGTRGTTEGPVGDTWKSPALFSRSSIGKANP